MPTDDYFLTEIRNNRCITKAKANAGIRVRWNIGILYIHLCWQTVEQQSKSALALASTVSAKFRNRGKLQIINLLRLFRSLKTFPDRKSILDRQNSVLDNFDFLTWLARLEFSARQTYQDKLDFSTWQNCSTTSTNLTEILGQTFNEFFLSTQNLE